MGFWREQASSEGKGDATKLPPGEHDVTIARVVFGPKDGVFKSRNGDPKIGIAYADAEEREAFEMFTLSEKAAWKLAKMLECAGLDIDKMDAANITPAHFANPRFANKNLVGRKLRIDIVYDKDNYALVTPMRAEPVTAGAVGNIDDIPF